MSELFNALLDISRLDAGIIEVDLKVMDIIEILEPVTKEFKVSVSSKELIFKNEMISCIVKTDPILLQRIVRNLLSNALKYTSNGAIGIRIINTSENTIRLEVFDSGPGITEPEILQIFKEFYQIGNTERDRSKGIGLGLAIVRRLSLLLESSVGVSSSAEGSVFYLTLNVAEIGLDKMDITTTKWVNIDSRQVIAFIDDESSIRASMRSIFRQWGYVIITAEDSTSCLKKLLSESLVPDLIITDYRLPDNNNGLEAIEMLQDEFNCTIPSLIITGDSSSKILSNIAEAGISVLLKPVSPEKLHQTVTKLLSVTSSEVVS
jgi:CheY-like chemotaxis protein/anti-sigma regulatory factor (Ser/Thr protein kinase)